MNRIKEIRDARGLSLEQVAAMVEPPTSAMQINRLEKAQRKLSPEWIEKLSKALNEKPAFIAGYDDEDDELDRIVKKVTTPELRDMIAKMIRGAIGEQ